MAKIKNIMREVLQCEASMAYVENYMNDEGPANPNQPAPGAAGTEPDKLKEAKEKLADKGFDTISKDIDKHIDKSRIIRK